MFLKISKNILQASETKIEMKNNSKGLNLDYPFGYDFRI